MRARAEIAAEIAREQERLADLRERAAASTAHLAALREEIGAIPQVQLSIVAEPTAAPSFAPISAALTAGTAAAGRASGKVRRATGKVVRKTAAEQREARSRYMREYRQRTSA